MNNFIVSVIISFLAVLQVQFYITPKKKIYLIFHIAIITVLTYLYLTFNGNVQRIIITLSSLIIMIPVCIMSYREKLYSKLYNLLIQAIVSGVSIYFSEYIYVKYSYELGMSKLLFSVSVILMNILWGVIMYFMRHYKFTLMPYDEKSYRKCFIICVVIYIPFLFCTWGMDSVIFPIMSENMPYIVVVSIVVIILVIMNNFLITKSVLMKEHKLNIISIQSRLFKQYMEDLQDYKKRMRIMQHDQKHYIGALQALLENGNINRAIQLLKEIQERNTEHGEKFFCKEPLINSILLDSSYRAERQNTKFEATVRLDESININDLDISTIMLNALNNALECCAKLPSSIPREIRTFIYTAGGYFVLKTENYMSDKPVIVNGMIETSKTIDKNMHGIGLESIKYIAKLYNGMVNIEAGYDDVFRLKVVMENSNIS